MLLPTTAYQQIASQQFFCCVWTKEKLMRMGREVLFFRFCFNGGFLSLSWVILLQTSTRNWNKYLVFPAVQPLVHNSCSLARAHLHDDRQTLQCHQWKKSRWQHLYCRLHDVMARRWSCPLSGVTERRQGGATVDCPEDISRWRRLLCVASCGGSHERIHDSRRTKAWMALNRRSLPFWNVVVSVNSGGCSSRTSSGRQLSRPPRASRPS